MHCLHKIHAKPIIDASSKLPASVHELIKDWNRSFGINDPWNKAKWLFHIWDKLILSVKNKKRTKRDRRIFIPQKTFKSSGLNNSKELLIFIGSAFICIV